MQRNRTFWILTLIVIFGVGYLLADYFMASPPATAIQPLNKTEVTVSRETTKLLNRSTKNLNLDKKNNVKPEGEEDAPAQLASEKEKENVETKFQTMRDEQRRQWQDIFGDDRDKMRAVIRGAIDNNPEFSEMFRRARELRDNWATSGDTEKPQMLAELADLRQKSLEIIKAELAKYNSTAAATPAPAANDGNAAPANPTGNPSENPPAAEPEAPKEPTVIM